MEIAGEFVLPNTDTCYKAELIKIGIFFWSRKMDESMGEKIQGQLCAYLTEEAFQKGKG